jgi:hypothetical protein
MRTLPHFFPLRMLRKDPIRAVVERFGLTLATSRLSPINGPRGEALPQC